MKREFTLTVSSKLWLAHPECGAQFVRTPVGLIKINLKVLKKVWLSLNVDVERGNESS